MLQTVSLPNCYSVSKYQRYYYRRSSRSIRLDLKARNKPLQLASNEERVTSLITLYASKRKHKRIAFETAENVLNVFVRHGFEYEDVLKYAKYYPRTLAYDASKVEALFNALAQVGFSQDEIKTLVSKHPAVLGTSLTNLLEMSEYCQESLLMEKSEFVNMLLRRPSTLTLSVHQNIVPTCEYYSKELQIEDKYMKKMIMSKPQVLAYSLETKIKRIVHYLVNEMNIPQEILSKRIRQNPAVLGSALDSIKHKVDFIKNTLEFSDEDLTTFLCRGLTVLNFSEETIEEKIKQLCSQFNQPVKDCGLLFLTYPQLITLSSDTLNEKIKFLTEEVDRDLDEIFDYPVILGYSVEKRIRPRMETLRAHQISPRSFGLSTLFSVSDEKFQKFVKDVAERIELDRIEREMELRI